MCRLILREKNVLQGNAWPWYILRYDTEKLLKAAIITTEHAVVLDRIREETSQDGVHCTRKLGKQQKRCRIGCMTLLPSQGLELYKS